MIKFVNRYFVISLTLTLLFIGQFTLNIKAVPVISSVSPNSSDLAGGSTISLNGSGFVENVYSGSVDTSFDSGTGSNGIVRATTTQADGKIIIGGQFSNYNGTNINRIARLNTDGSLDTSFVVGSGANNIVYTARIQTDGKIIIGGQFTSFNGTARNRIARLNTDGSLDTSFVVGSGAQNQIRSLSLQTDGKIIIGGQFTSYDGTARNRIARLNTDGSLDTGFVVGSGTNSSVFATNVQTDGKIIIGGQFTSFNGTARNRIARLNTDGRLDTSFVVGTGSNNIVYTARIQTDGKIIIGGQFTSYDGTGTNRIARLNTDGSLDTNFIVGGGASSIIYAARIQTDGKIIIGGQFTSFDGTSTNQIGRLNGIANTISVNIGSNPCTTLVFVSSVELTCIVPAGITPGFADVTVINPNLESFVLSDGFSYTSTPYLAFKIRDSSDTNYFNSCDFEVASIDNFSQCSYRLKVTSNLVDGYFLFVETSGDLKNGVNSIQNAAAGTGGAGGTDISSSNTGIENYSVRILKGKATNSAVSLNSIFDAGANSTLFNYTWPISLLETYGANFPGAVDTTNSTLVNHNLNISAVTPAGQYSQIATYTVISKF